MRLLPCAPVSSLVILCAACGSPTNPCDPGAPLDVQAQGTEISGTVVDQDGAGVAGVAVGVAGRAETQVSGEGGVFTFTNLPPSSSYELVATPAAPLVGGRAKTPALTCAAHLDDVTVGVVVPPASPEVEVVQAASERSLFAAFGATADDDAGDVAAFFEDGDTHRRAVDVAADCAARVAASTIAYRVQVRAPFEEWKDAVLAPFPWVDRGDGPAEAYGDRVDDVCAKAACAQFAYLEPSLENPRARCVDVVGYREPGDAATVTPLEAYGSYQVRALAELRTPDDARVKYALPERVLAAPPATAGQMSLVAGSLLPVVGTDGLPRVVGDVSGIASTAGGRFALVESGALSVIGDGKDTLSSAAQDSVGATTDAPQGAFGEDAAATGNVATDFASDAAVAAVPLAILPAGDWVRVVRRLDDGSASVEKVFVGDDAAAAAAGPDTLDAVQNAEQPALHVDPASAEAGTALRAFAYVAPNLGRLDERGVDPPNAYMLLYGSAFVITEQGPQDALALGYFANDAQRDVDGNIIDTGWAASADDSDPSAGFDGACSRMASDPGAAPDSVKDAGFAGHVNVSLCYDIGSALGDDVDLRDIKVFEDDVLGARALFSDAHNDRLIVASQGAMTCATCDANSATPLAAQLEDVRVGREPLGMAKTKVLDCSGAGADRAVVLVANHGSGDLSVVEDRDGDIRETGVVPLPAAPLGFLDDPAGASCDDPFVWVIADDGSVVPVDMRGEPSVPVCKNGSCNVGTRGRGSVGAISRGGVGHARSLVGGNGLLGELGFFRPKALKGGAFDDAGDLAAEPPTSAPAPAP